MRALGSPARGFLTATAFAAFAGAFAGVPLGAHGAASLAVARPSPLAVRGATDVAVVAPRRDPFAGGPPPAIARVAATAAALEPAVHVPAALVPLPPNAGAGAAPFPFGGETVRVRAVVTGARPFALVEEAGGTRLVTIGDALAGDSVAAITAGGVRLARGRSIGVAPAPLALPAAAGGDPP